jgi:hypothetical protein
MRNMKLALALVASLIAFACPAVAQSEFKTPAAGKTVVGFQVMCQNGSNQAVPCGSASNPLQIAGTFSAALGGFTPSLSGARGTPISVTVADSSGPLPSGTVVDVSNVGSNPMYCNVNGVAATVADKLIAANSWFEFTIPTGITTLHCIATGGSTTANTVGGAGLGTGAGGGSSGGSGGNVNLTQILGAAPSATNPLWVSPASGATFPVSAASLPLPSGAGTAANQTTIHNDLVTLNTTAGNPITLGSATGGWTPLILSGLTNTATAVKASAGQVGELYCYNPNASVAYIQVFNVAFGSVTVGTTVPLHSYGIPATNSGGFSLPLVGMQFSTAISVAATTTAKGGTAPTTAMDCNVAFN